MILTEQFNKNNIMVLNNFLPEGLFADKIVSYKKWLLLKVREAF